MLRKLMQGVGIAALLLAAVTFVTAPSAQAKKGNTETVALVPPDHAGDTGASGKVKVVHRAKGDRMIVRVKKLARRTVYNVLDGDNGELLGTLRTNKRGRGRLVIREGTAGRRGKSGRVDELPESIEITEEGDDECILETEGDPPLIGSAEYQGDAGHHAFITLISIPAKSVGGGENERDVVPDFEIPDFEIPDIECFILTLTPPAEGDEKFPRSSYELMLDSVSGDEMPLGVAHAADLAERAFEIRDGDGNVWIAGNLPAVEPITHDDPVGLPGPWPMPEIDFPDFDLPDFDLPDFDFPDRGDRPAGNDGPGIASLLAWEPVESDVTLWIADEDGVLTLSHNLLLYEWPVFDWPTDGEWDERGEWERDGTDGGNALPNDLGFPIRVR